MAPGLSWSLNKVALCEAGMNDQTLVCTSSVGCSFSCCHQRTPEDKAGSHLTWGIEKGFLLGVLCVPGGMMSLRAQGPPSLTTEQEAIQSP